jgi:hypothetical protein
MEGRTDIQKDRQAGRRETERPKLTWKKNKVNERFDIEPQENLEILFLAEYKEQNILFS